jgi:hypothetical protein
MTGDSNVVVVDFGRVLPHRGMLCGGAAVRESLRTTFSFL